MAIDNACKAPSHDAVRKTSTYSVENNTSTICLQKPVGVAGEGSAGFLVQMHWRSQKTIQETQKSVRKRIPGSAFVEGMKLTGEDVKM